MEKVIHELRIFSSNMIEEPAIRSEGMDITVVLKGYDDNDRLYESTIKFSSVIGYKYNRILFAYTMGAYDKVIQIENSDWKEEFRTINEEKYNYWKPNHYAIFLDDYGLYQFMAQKVEVTENELY